MSDDQLIADFLDGELSDDESRRVADRILEDDAFARCVYRESRELTMLGHWARVEVQKTKMERKVEPARTFPRKLVVGLLAFAASFVIALVWVGHDDATASPCIVDHLGGQVFITVDGFRRPAKENDQLTSGLIETVGPLSFLTLSWADGTKLVMAGETTATIGARDLKFVVVDNGIVSASVAPQSNGRPMIVETPKNRLEILGTKFVVEASSEHTDLRVTEGRVRFARKSNGDSVIVSEGQQGLNDIFSPDLQVLKLDAQSETFDVNFEDGDPAGWGPGSLVDVRLPEGSSAAIQADKANDWNDWAIVAPDRRMDGWFVIRDDSQLHITFKMERPEWLNIFMMVHTGDDSDPSDLLMCNGAPFRRADPNVWYTMTMPLGKWKRNNELRSEFIDGPPKSGEVVYALRVSSSQQDRGLVIDRVWVTRGGADEYQLKLLESKE